MLITFSILKLLFFSPKFTPQLFHYIIPSPIAKADNSVKITQRPSVKGTNSEPERTSKVGMMVTNLMEYVNARHNVNHAINGQIRAIRAAYLEVERGEKTSNASRN